MSIILASPLKRRYKNELPTNFGKKFITFGCRLCRKRYSRLMMNCNLIQISTIYSKTVKVFIYQMLKNRHRRKLKVSQVWLTCKKLYQSHLLLIRPKEHLGHWIIVIQDLAISRRVITCVMWWLYITKIGYL